MANVLFIGAHQDDETLLMGGGIINHLASGTNNVYYACITDGSASGVRTTLGMDVPTFVGERNYELNNALWRMGNVHHLEAAQGRMTDGTLNIDPNMGPGNSGYNGNDIAPWKVNMGIVDRIRNLMAQVANTNGCATTAVRVKTNSYMDPHPDHRAISQAILYMYDRGEITDLRMYVSPLQWSAPYTDANGATFMSAAQLNASQEKPASGGAFANAILEYVGTNYSCGGYRGYSSVGIGYLSVPGMFDLVMSNKYSMYHVPPTTLYRS